MMHKIVSLNFAFEVRSSGVSLIFMEKLVLRWRLFCFFYQHRSSLGQGRCRRLELTKYAFWGEGCFLVYMCHAEWFYISMHESRRGWGGGLFPVWKNSNVIKHTDSKITKSSNSSTPPPAPCKQVCSSTNDHWTELYRKEFLWSLKNILKRVFLNIHKFTFLNIHLYLSSHAKRMFQDNHGIKSIQFYCACFLFYKTKIF